LTPYALSRALRQLRPRVCGPAELKSRAGRRKVPIAAILRDYLVEHLARVDPRGDELIFGNSAKIPFTPNMLQRRADKAWKEARLERVTPHVGRHSFAAMAIASGVNAKALSTFMGHSSIQVTFDKYGGLLPGSEEEAAGLLNAYFEAQLESAAVQTRGATGERAGEPVAVGESETAD
jgi:integrase